jgi:hypothetical protein
MHWQIAFMGNAGESQSFKVLWGPPGGKVCWKSSDQVNLLLHFARLMALEEFERFFGPSLHQSGCILHMQMLSQHHFTANAGGHQKCSQI